MQALIGSRGTVGSALIDQMSFDQLYNSDNIETIKHQTFDLLVCAAPSGNRLDVNQNPESDMKSIDRLINCLNTVTAKHFVLIGTVDAVTFSQSAYGYHRLRLERFVQNRFDYHTVLRLSTLIGPTIKKNVLFDLANQCYLDSLDPDSELQWCSLNTLAQEISHCVEQQIALKNLVSEPVINKEIVEMFFKELSNNIGTKVEHKKYNLTPYCLTKQQVFAEIEKYLHLRR